MILAAGYGTRLRPLTFELPKPLVWVGDKPAIYPIVEQLRRAGIDRLVVNTHHKGEAFSKDILSLFSMDLTIVTEVEILGTGGGVANASAFLGDGLVVVWNGDILVDLNVEALLPKCRGEVTLVAFPRPCGDGTLGVGADGKVVRLRGETFGVEVQGGDFLGVSVLGPEFRATLPIPGCLIGEGVLPWLRRGRWVDVHFTTQTWEDIGSLESYLNANKRWLEKYHPSGYVHPTAHVSQRVKVEGSIVGKGARVDGEGGLVDCIVWPGAVATAPLSRSVITTEGRVVAIQEKTFQL
ncbi:MAG: NDP-sugar synthase [Polyangiaceae bacterium]|nr:NDP-sugar synthase [Polyangiaceae bacterium]